MDTCENFLPLAQGALARRSGTRFVAEVKDSTAVTRLVPFEFSTDQAYILEFGDLYMRVFANHGVVESSPGVAYELVTPYTTAQIPDLAFAQSGDILYIVHPDVAVSTITRFDDADWEYENVGIKISDGPYLDIETPGWNLVTSNLATTATTYGTKYFLTVDAGPELTVGTTTNIGSGITEVNTTANHGYFKGMKVSFKNGGSYYGPFEITSIVDLDTFQIDYGTYLDLSAFKCRPAPFETLDITRKIRLLYGSTWIGGYIGAAGGAWESVGVTRSVAMDATIPNATTITSWAQGVFYGTAASGGPGQPAAIAFHEDRLFIGGSAGHPQIFAGSKSSDYLNFAPTEPDGTVVGDSSVNFTLNQGGVDRIRWFSSDEKGLLIGTAGAEYWVRGATQYEAISATNVNVKKSTSYGSAACNVVQAGKGTMFLQRSGRKIRELAYFYDKEGFSATDMSILSEHITYGGVTALAFQREPNPTIWAVRGDGTLLGLSYERDLDSLRAGWHRHIIGGSSDPTASPSIVESIAVIPSPDGTRYDLWLAVQRYINGATFRSVEYVEQVFDETVAQADAFFVDCGLTYSSVNESAILGRAAATTVNFAAHGLTTGDNVRLRNVVGFTGIEDEVSAVTVVDVDHFTLDSIDTSGQTYASAYADIYKMADTVSGLDHLEGETVSISGDGSVFPDAVVTTGAITISQECAVINVGLPYTSNAKLLRLDSGSADGTSIGKKRRMSQVSYMLNRTAAFKHGTDFDNLDQLTFRTSSDPLNEAAPLFTGIKEERIEGTPDTENQICIRQDQPLPLMLLAVMPQLMTEGKG